MSDVRKVFRPYVAASVNNVEQWLSTMSENGWTLYEVDRWVFAFRKSFPKHKEFFMYWSLDRNTVAFNNYLSIKQRYEKSGCSISTSGICIFEADSLKIDATYVHSIDERNEYFLNYSVKMLVAALICDIFVLLLFLLFGEIGRTTFLTLFIIFFAVAVYFFASTILLYNQRRKISKRL